MNDRQLIEAFQNTLKRADETLLNAVKDVWNKLHRNPESKSITIRCSLDTLSLWQDVFRGCIETRGLKYVLNCNRLRESADQEMGYTTWLELLQQAAGFTTRQKSDDKDSIVKSLEFKLPHADWNELKQHVTKKTPLELLQNAWTTAECLRTNTTTYAPAELGSKLFHDSKRLKNPTLMAWTCRFLRQQLPAEELDDEQLLEKLGLVPNPTASRVLVCGPFTYSSNGTEKTWIRDLADCHESACLTAHNLSNLENVTVTRPVLTIENESVFNRMMTQNENFALVYTAGFPSSAVRAWIAALQPDTPLFHWGDGDPEGLEIAAILNHIHPLNLYRMDTKSLESMKDAMQPMPEHKLRRARKLALLPDFPFQKELTWMIEHHCWLEQEAFFNQNDSPKN